jgi:hypothetical protein
VKEKFDLWSQAVKQWGKWTLDGIAKSVYIIACHVHDHQEKICKNRDGGSVSTNYKVDALVLIYSFSLSEINLAEVIHRLQNKAAAKSLQ